MPAARVSPAIEHHPLPPASRLPALNSDHDDLVFYRQRDGLGITSSSEEAPSEATTSSLASPCPLVSPYQRLLDALNHDDRWQKDVALGRRVGFYRFRGDLGSGNFSQVKLAVHCLVKEKVAVKILDKSKLDAKTQRMLRREIASMEELHHPHLIRLYEVVETLSRVYLVMEFAPGGELFHKITSDGRYPEADARLIFAQITSAVDHMHQHNILHRDIKAENVFIAGHNIVKVGDFGFSTQVRFRDDALNTFCGSPPYAAPELFKDESYIGPYVDIWALGVLLYFIVTSTMPFKAQTVAALKKLILDGQYQVPNFLSEPCRTLISGILQQVPQERLSIADINSSDWLKGQRLPESYPKYNMYPTMEPGDLVSDEEYETRLQLHDLGITEDMMKDCSDKGARSSITGAYRIVLHKIQTAPPPDMGDSESAGTATGTPSPGGKVEKLSAKTERLFLSKGRRSTTCAVL
ncbi:serine/threonine-protein kinase NIM1-like [Ornithodoros turicata]|uniref:serine/threonine-protein kinase NIM1-like n=1 Tax=Ornithodoros turicata TaxID=34597 RepID=UPI0031398943